MKKRNVLVIQVTDAGLEVFMYNKLKPEHLAEVAAGVVGCARKLGMDEKAFEEFCKLPVDEGSERPMPAVFTGGE